MKKWISIKERKPTDTYVIGFALSPYHNLWYVRQLRYAPELSGVPFYDDANDEQPREVPYWMPLPSKPKGVTR